MASIDSNTTIQLDKEEKELLEAALKKIEEITDDVQNEDMWIDEDSVFYCLRTAYKSLGGKLPTIVEII